jgi:hypothetical protein
MPSGPVDGEDRYVQRMKINGKPYFEVGIRDPDGEGYLIERIPVNESSNHYEIEESIGEAQEGLEKRKSQAEDTADWFEEFQELSEKMDKDW